MKRFKRLKGFKRNYTTHNLLGHPIAEVSGKIVSLLFGKKIGNKVWMYVHDQTLPETN